MPRPAPKFLADENLDERVVEHLRARGVDIQSLVSDHPQFRKASDYDVLALATAQERVLLTYNRKDFKALHRKNLDHAGIGLVSEFHDPEREAEAIFRRWSDFAPGTTIRIVRGT